MQILYKILVLLLLIATGFILVPLIINLMIWADFINTKTVPNGYLSNMIEKSSIVWIGGIILGIVSMFFNQNGKYQKKLCATLLFCPLALPSIFIVIYTLVQS